MRMHTEVQTPESEVQEKMLLLLTRAREPIPARWFSSELLAWAYGLCSDEPLPHITPADLVAASGQDPRR